MEIKKNIHYVGVNDRNKYLFEGLWPLPYGVSYNSYLIDDEKVCLVDTVEVDFFSQFLENIHEAIGDKPIDYIIVNHLEPDHSGSLALMKKYYPEARIIGNAKTFAMLKDLYNLGEDGITVDATTQIDLGQHKLAFALIPMVHWPETMVSIETTENIVFSGDAFGCFGALNGGVIDSEINCDAFFPEMVRYYSNIVGKYGSPVQAALKKLEGVSIDYICPTHGPVWHELKDKVIGIYDRLSRYDSDPGLVICYGTMYGNTERLAERIARAASAEGIKDIVVHNVSKTHHSYIIADIFRYRGLIVGAPTYNAGLYHEMDMLLSEIANRNMKNRYFGWFGSHGWASMAVKKIQEWNDNSLHFEAVGTPVDMRLGINASASAACDTLGKAMAEALKK